jgi:protein RecA
MSANSGGGSDAPSAVSSSRVKKREIPTETILQKPDSELAILVRKITDSGDYGEAFHIANSKKFTAPRLETGVLALDLTLGGGFSMGRASMVYGERSAGKSTTACLCIASVQRKYPDSAVVIIDAEGTFDKAWARKLGCDLSRIVIAEPESGEHAIDICDGVIRAKEVSMVVTDSIAALVPMKEIEESAMQEFMGLQARLIGKYVRKAQNALLSERKRDHLVHHMCLNQFRMKIGLVFGDPRTLPGGKAIEFFMSQQLEIKNKEHFGKDDVGDDIVLYNEHMIKITKNKTGGPLREGMFKLVRAPHSGMIEGWVDQAKAVVSSGLKVGVIHGSPSAFSIDGVSTKFRGSGQLTEWAIENQTVYNRVISNIVDAYRRRWNLE